MICFRLTNRHDEPSSASQFFHVRRLIMLTAVVGAALIVASCNLLGNDDDDADRDGWKSVSMPSGLKGDWYANEYYETRYMLVTSNEVHMNNRIWSIQAIETQSDQYRLLAKSTNQYRAFFFRDIAEESVEISLGFLAFTTYDAKQSETGNWYKLTRLRE